MGCNLRENVEKATRTESKIPRAFVNTKAMINAFAILVAIGEIVDQLKKNIFYGSEIDNDQIKCQLLSITHHSRLLGEVNDLNSGKEPSSIDPRILHCMMGIITEGIELLQSVNPWTGEIDKINAIEETFDIDWYQFILSDALDIDLGEIWDAGFAKLQARYPEKFSQYHAENRNTNKEREILEQVEKSTG